MSSPVRFFTRAKSGFSFGTITDTINLTKPDPNITVDGPSIYSHNGKYLAVVRPQKSGFTIFNANDQSIYLDVCSF